MPVKETSREAWANVTESGRRGQLRSIVALYLERNPEQTRAQIAEGTGVRINSVCSPVLDLLNGRHVEIVRKDFCPITGHRAEVLKLTGLGEMLVATLRKGGDHETD